MNPGKRTPHRLLCNEWAWTLAVAILVFAVTAAPYFAAAELTPDGSSFSGRFAYPNDQNMYFSFIRQAADGEILFQNRYTHVDHAPVFFNLQWLLVGGVLAVVDSELWAYHIWRFAGALLTVLGFATLARTVLQSPRARFVALMMCAVGGGFAWMILGLERLGAGPFHTAARLELAAGIHPFNQIMHNPNFSLPLGMFLFFAAAFCKAERTGQARWYALAALLAALDGLCRPYDLITLGVLIPLLALLDLVRSKRWDWRILGLRSLTLVAIAPVLAYYGYLFTLHPVFKFWASQGQLTDIPIYWHVFSLGLAAAALFVRWVADEEFGLGQPAERFLVAWVVAVFALFHASKIPFLSFMPFTPQLGNTLVPAIILLAAGALDPPDRARRRLRAPALAAIAGLLLVNATSSLYMLWTQTFAMTPNPNALSYVSESNLAAYRWLERHATESDVILSAALTGNELAAITGNRVLIGHWSVTPEFTSTQQRVVALFSGRMDAPDARRFLRETGTDWIFLGPRELELGRGRNLLPEDALELAYRNDEVAVFRVVDRPVPEPER